MVGAVLLTVCLKWMFQKIGGKPPKWMVKIMENPIKMDDVGVPLFWETPLIFTKLNYTRKKN